MFQLVTKIGFIGSGNHAFRLMQIINQIPNNVIKFIFHPKKNLNDSFTNDLSDLYQCDAIFILSPNHTHFYYMENLFQNYDGYIFCEKPPVISYDELNHLEKISFQKKEKLFFNFNYRFGKINECINEQKSSEHIGKINHINIIASHGLAFKSDYFESWRADGEKNLFNILDTLSIHYLDLLNLNFGNPIEKNFFPKLISNHGKSYDTNLIILKYDNDITISLLNSYASPYINQISILGTNGFLNIFDNSKRIFSPRDSFNSKNFFITPPILSDKKFIFEDEYNNSLVNSVTYFLNIVKKQGVFPIEQFETSLFTNKLILDLRK